jgi:NADH:ubiquinone oxidoreductase subunit E
MKKIILLICIIGCIMVAGCVTDTAKNTTPASTASPTISVPPANVPTTLPVSASGGVKGRLIVAIGEYNATLPVTIDNTSVGNVSLGKPLNITVNEGLRTVRVCSGTRCEQVQVEIKSAIKTSLDFEERLKNNAPQGSLSVSLGDYNANLPVFIDNASAGNVSTGKPLNLTVIAGRHTVKVCSGTLCEHQNVEIVAGKQTSVNFAEQLKKSIRQGPLMVSLGSYIAELPVLIDNTSVGNVSTGIPLNVMLSEGNHTVRVCVGLVCENEVVTIKFAQQSIVDFGDRLKKSAEFATPTVRIVNYFVTGNRLVVDAEFINPGKTDLSMTTTIGVGYSYIDSGTRQRENQYGQYRFTRSVRAGNRTKQSLEMTLSGGSSTIASEPKIVDVFWV